MLTEQQIKDVDKDLRDGVSPDDVASSLGISRSTLYAYLGRAGFEVDRKITWFLKPIERVDVELTEIVR